MRARGFLLVGIEQRDQPPPFGVQAGAEQCFINGLVERALVERGLVGLGDLGDLAGRSDSDAAVDDLVEHARILVTERVQGTAAV